MPLTETRECHGAVCNPRNVVLGKPWSLVVLEDKIGVVVPGLGLEGQFIVSIPGNLTQKLTSYEEGSLKKLRVEQNQFHEMLCRVTQTVSRKG